jgi:hypothetical protein
MATILRIGSRNLFTEEGRTRFRNFGVRLRSYLLVFLGLGLLAGAFWFSRGEMGTLGRLYFRQYIKVTVMSWISPERPGRYTLLTSGTLGVTDEMVYQVRALSSVLIGPDFEGGEWPSDKISQALATPSARLG